jgi:purine-nucleoside phosphorylase
MKISRNNFLQPEHWHQLRESSLWLKQHVTNYPTIGIVLGSGLGSFADRLEKKTVISVADIPHYPRQTVEGHQGRIIFGTLAGRHVVVFQGRVHFYETGDLWKTLYPIYIASSLGVKVLLITNAAGSVKRRFQPGDFMIIADQINLTFENPLQNLRNINLPNDRSLYDTRIQSLIEEVGYEKGIPVSRGIYCGVKGPSYETAAEIEMVRRLRADAVGMSTVNEVSLARALRMKVGGISCITNLATGIASQPLSHSEVTEVGRMVKKRFETLIRGVIEKL